MVAPGSILLFAPTAAAPAAVSVTMPLGGNTESPTVGEVATPADAAALDSDLVLPLDLVLLPAGAANRKKMPACRVILFPPYIRVPGQNRLFPGIPREFPREFPPGNSKSTSLIIYRCYDDLRNRPGWDGSELPFFLNLCLTAQNWLF